LRPSSDQLQVVALNIVSFIIVVYDVKKYIRLCHPMGWLPSSRSFAQIIQINITVYISSVKQVAYTKYLECDTLSLNYVNMSV